MVDLNPLHWIDKANHAFGDTLASQLEFLGITDPAVDPDGIREIAKKWRSLAKALEGAGGDAGTALGHVVWEGKAAKAFHKRAKKVRGQAHDSARALRKGATALDGFADEAHELLTEIGVILAEIIEFELAGLALDVLTAGLSSIASTLAAGERALKVVSLVRRIEEAGTRMGRTVRATLEAVRGLERALASLKDIKTLATAGKMAKDGMKFSAFATALEDPSAFKDPQKLAGVLTEGAVAGVGLGVLGKGLGKGLKALKPSQLAGIGKALKLDGSGLSRLRLRPSEWEKLPASIRSKFRECARDPIDVASGDMILPQTDVDLPGALPLVLERTHLSSCRWGGWFGPTWASTLDQRLQADDDGVVYAAPDGARLTYPYPESGGLPVRPESGFGAPLSWDGEVDGALRLTDPDTGVAYVFHSPRAVDSGDAVDLPLQSIVDRNGERITVHYADDGFPREVRHGGGYRVAVDRHPGLPDLPRVGALRLLDPARPDGRGTTLVAFGYDDAGHLAEVTDSSGEPMRFGYDTAGRITSWTDRNGTAYHYVYDDRGRVVRTEGSAGFLAGTLAYDDAAGTTTVTDSLGETDTYAYNEGRRVTCHTDPLGHRTHQEWDDRQRLTAVVDPLGGATRYEYDDDDRVVAVRRPDGRALTSRYGALGLPAAVTGPDGETWRQEYDERGNRTAVTDPEGTTTRFSYDRRGHLSSVTDASGGVTRVRCDPAGLPVEIADAAGGVTAYKRDGFGRPVKITDPLGARTRLTWTVEGRLASRTDPDGAVERWRYDGEGNCTAHTDPVGGVTRFAYTHFDLLAARTGPDGARYEFEHDTELRLRRVVDPRGLAWEYGYDPAGRLVAETDFDGRTIRYAHDAAGRLAARTNAVGQRIAFARDELGRIVRKTADGAETRYRYDPEGRLVEAAGPGSSVALRRDRLGRVTAEAVDGRPLTHRYDAAGRRVERVTPSGAVSSFGYDAAGRRTSVTAGGHTVEFTRDAAGREVGRTLDGLLEHSHVWDPAGRLAAQTVTGQHAGRVAERAYHYRADGHLTAVDDRLDGRRDFTLDGAGRVTEARAQGWSETYAYDATGNQTHASWPDAHAGDEARGERTYSGTRLRAAGRTRYTHDAAGRVTTRQRRRLSRKPDTWRYTWDAEDRLTSVTTPDGTIWRYVYDPLGRRTAKLRLAGDGETVVERTDFTWDGALLVEQTSTGPDLPDPVTLTWDHDGLHPITQAERITRETDQAEVDARFFAIVTDLVGTPTELLTLDGEIAWRTRATVWGTTTWNADATAYTPLRFPGQYHDPETGLHYNLHRHYDPETARYTTPDPLGLAPAPNPYTYVHNPHTWVDPLGLAPCPEGETGSGKSKETVLDTSESFEQARNKALHLLGSIDSATRQPYFGRLESAPTTFGKKVGFQTRVDGVIKRYRLDYDPGKGPHVNVEVGKGKSAQKWAVPWSGSEEDFARILRGNA